MIDKALHFFVFTQKTKEEKYPIVEINRENVRVLDAYDDYTDMCSLRSLLKVDYYLHG